jgi:hypothetical protein
MHARGRTRATQELWDIRDIAGQMSHMSHLSQRNDCCENAGMVHNFGTMMTDRGGVCERGAQRPRVRNCITGSVKRGHGLAVGRQLRAPWGRARFYPHRTRLFIVAVMLASSATVMPRVR